MRDVLRILSFMIVLPFVALIAVLAIGLWITHSLPSASASRGSLYRVSTRLAFMMAAVLAGTVASAPALAGGAPTSFLTLTQHSAQTAPLASSIMTAAPAGTGGPMLAEKAPEGAGAWQENLAWILGLIILGLQVADRLKPTPALHKQFADKEETEAYRAELKKMIERVDTKLTTWSSDQYAARRRMHHKINAMQNALAFLAGAMEADDNPRAEKFRAMIEKANGGGSSDE